MGKIDAALAQFDEAIERLEVALHRQSTRTKDGDKAQGDVAALKEDRRRLAAELETVRNEVKRLGALNERASERVSGAIHSIRRVLAET